MFREHDEVEYQVNRLFGLLLVMVLTTIDIAALFFFSRPRRWIQTSLQCPR